MKIGIYFILQTVSSAAAVTVCFLEKEHDRECRGLITHTPRVREQLGTGVGIELLSSLLFWKSLLTLSHSACTWGLSLSQNQFRKCTFPSQVSPHNAICSHLLLHRQDRTQCSRCSESTCSSFLFSNILYPRHHFSNVGNSRTHAIQPREM